MIKQTIYYLQAILSFPNLYCTSYPRQPLLKFEWNHRLFKVIYIALYYAFIYFVSTNQYYTIDNVMN